MLDWIFFFGWLLPPLLVPMGYYIIRRANIGRPIRFLFHAYCMAVLLYWLLAFPLALYLCIAFPSSYVWPPLYDVQALLTVPMLWVLVRAERKQHASETNGILKHISNSTVRHKWRLAAVLLVAIFCAHQLIGRAIYRIHTGTSLPPGIIITSWSETPRFWLGDGTAHVSAFGLPWAIDSLLASELWGRPWSRGAVPVRVYWKGSGLQQDDGKMFIQNVRQTDDHGAMWNGEVLVVYPNYYRILLYSYDF